MTRARRFAALAGALVAIAVGIFGARRLAGSRPSLALGDTTRAPQGQSTVVEVLNASGTTGLAKRATFYLRDRGFDVVYFGNDPLGRLSKTLVVDYTNKPDAAEVLAKVLGGATIQRGRDSLQRGLDITVRLGSDYRPLSETFHP